VLHILGAPWGYIESCSAHDNGFFNLHAWPAEFMAAHDCEMRFRRACIQFSAARAFAPLSSHIHKSCEISAVPLLCTAKIAAPGNFLGGSEYILHG
jgi:hypothetical protein